jgi:hypothetical protein
MSSTRIPGDDITWVHELAQQIFRSASDQLITEMLRHGEDPTNDELRRVRKGQLGYSLKSEADRRTEEPPSVPADHGLWPWEREAVRARGHAAES